MFEILATSAWLLEAKYFGMVYPVLLDRMQAGQELMPALVQASRRRSERYGEDGLPQMFYGQPSASVMEEFAGMAASGKSSATTGQKVAIIPLQGTMMKNGGYCSLGTKEVISMIQQANADPNVSGIVLDVDSPGGAVDGTEELARVVLNSKKPIVAYGDGLVASAAYWVASQASKLYINSLTTAYVGSIGVLATHTNAQEFLAKMGQKITILRSTKAVDKARMNSVEPLTDELIEEYTKQLDTIHETFISAVKKGRGDKLAKDANPWTGKVYSGQEAKKMGLVDAVGTLEDAVNEAHRLAVAGPSATHDNLPVADTPPPANSFFSNMKFPRIAALLGFKAGAEAADKTGAAAADDNQEVTEQSLTAAEQALEQRDQRLAELEQQLAEANTLNTTTTAQLAEARQELATLQQWRREHSNVDPRAEDESNKWDEGDEGMSPNERAAAEALAEQQRIKKAKAK
jgi:protease-4